MSPAGRTGILIGSACLYLCTFPDYVPVIAFPLSAVIGILTWWQTAFWSRWNSLRRSILDTTDTAVAALNDCDDGIDAYAYVRIDMDVYPVIYLIIMTSRGEPVGAWRGVLFRRRELVLPSPEKLRLRKSMVS